MIKEYTLIVKFNAYHARVINKDPVCLSVARENCQRYREMHGGDLPTGQSIHICKYDPIRRDYVCIDCATPLVPTNIKKENINVQ